MKEPMWTFDINNIIYLCDNERFLFGVLPFWRLEVCQYLGLHAWYAHSLDGRLEEVLLQANTFIISFVPSHLARRQQDSRKCLQPDFVDAIMKS